MSKALYGGWLVDMDKGGRWKVAAGPGATWLVARHLPRLGRYVGRQPKMTCESTYLAWDGASVLGGKEPATAPTYLYDGGSAWVCRCRSTNHNTHATYSPMFRCRTRGPPVHP